jgi:hypothetical protein
MTTKQENIQCYKKNIWQIYQQGMLDEELALSMEEHLLVCEECLEHYLETVNLSIKQEQVAGEFPLNKLPEDFTDKVMSLVARADSNHDSNQNRQPKANLFLYYCAVASIAFTFWVSGIFNGFSGLLSKDMDNGLMIRAQEKINGYSEDRQIIQWGWTEKIDDRQPTVIDQILKGVKK